MKKYKKKFKISKNLIIGITGILFSIGFPFIVLPVFVPAKQLWTPEFAISAVSLFLTFYSVEAAILIAVLIYKMQKLDMEKEHEKRLRMAKSAMGTALESGIGWIICPQMNRYPGIASTTKEIFMEYMAELQEILDSDQYRFLLQAVERIDAAVCKEDDEAADTRPFIREWLWVLSRSEYSKYFEHVQEWHTLLNKETYELFVTLGMDSGSYEKVDLIYDWDDAPLILKGDLPTEYYISCGEERILAAIMGIDSMGNAKIVQGYGKSKEYIGYYKNWQFHGKGCEYDWKGEKCREGIFHEGTLQKGIEYNWLIKAEEGKYTKYFQCGKRLNLTKIIEEEIEHEGREKYFISDFEVDGETEREINRRPLAYQT